MNACCCSPLVLAWVLLAGCAPNSAPLLNSLRTSTFQLPVGQTLSVAASASDVDADRLSYAWSASCPGTFSHPTSSSTDFTPTELPERACDNCSLTVSVTDGHGGETHGSLALCVTRARPPLIVSSWRSSQTVSAPPVARTPLPPGTVLVSGGMGSMGSTATAEEYDPSTGLWSTVAALPEARGSPTAMPLPDGTVLVVGGLTSAGSAPGTAYPYTP